MTTTLRWFLVATLAGHGLIHLLGVVKGFGWADVSPLAEINRRRGRGGLAGRRRPRPDRGSVPCHGAPTWWWTVALGAAVISQIAITSSWRDARAGPS